MARRDIVQHDHIACDFLIRHGHVPDHRSLDQGLALPDPFDQQGQFGDDRQVTIALVL